jgi:hypothetical protein
LKISIYTTHALNPYNEPPNLGHQEHPEQVSILLFSDQNAVKIGENSLLVSSHYMIFSNHKNKKRRI